MINQILGIVWIIIGCLWMYTFYNKELMMYGIVPMSFGIYRYYHEYNLKILDKLIKRK